jgi:hypothetical protein
MGICYCLPGPQTSSHQAEVLLIEHLSLGKNEAVVIAQIFDHCQLARMHSRTLLEAAHPPSSSERVGAKRPDAFADLSFLSAAISAGYNSAGCATRSRDPLRLCPQDWPCRENLTVSRFRLRSRFRPRARANDRPIPFVARPMVTYRFGSAAC